MEIMREEESSCSRRTSRSGEFVGGQREDSMEKHYLRPPPSTDLSHPWLLICHGQYGYRQTFYNIHEDRYYTKVIPQFHRKYIYPTNISQWLVVEDEDSLECCLWNIVSFDNIKIPSLGADVEGKCVLTSPPQGEHDCHIVFMAEQDNTIRFCKLGDKAFRPIKLPLGENESLHSITVFKGVVYLLTLGCALFEVKMSPSSSIQATRLTWSQRLSDLLPCHIQAFQVYLVGSEDELLLVLRLRSTTASFKTFSFYIFRMNFCLRMWERVKAIREMALFLSDNISLACTPSNHGVKNNFIYYVVPGDRSLYLFDLKDQSTLVSVPCPVVSRRTSYLMWIMF